MRKFEFKRKTNETDIVASINLDQQGTSVISTGIGFFDHMLTAFAVHSGIELKIKAVGDIFVDCHHTVEDVGIVLGKLIEGALGDKSGIKRYGSAYIPMDEALGFCSLDISNRAFLVFNAKFENQSIGEFDCCMVEEFFRAVAFNSGITLHLKCEYGKNDHHICEALFKAFAHAFKQAAFKTQDDQTLSSKGVI